ncbi:cell wall protein, partial [Trichoderma longibrachiatum ATCC 18648]
LLALLGSAMVDALAPRADAGNCASSYNGKFQVTVSKINKRDIEKRDCSNPNALLLTLNDGVLKDAKGRTGYIASNFQWQFDQPPQANALVTSGFSACDNGALGLKGSTTFWQCLSGNFYNLYDRNWAPQCQPVELVILPCSGGSAGHSNKGSDAEGGSGGQGVNQAVTAIPDGQPQAPVSQGGDGQPQAPPVTQISDGQPQGPTGSPAPPVSQISDGQPQVPTGSPAPPVTQISDGQPQVPTGSPASPVTQISDGQPQVPTGSPAPPVTQISDGQPQVPTGAPQPPVAPPVTQISDGQPQAPTGTGSPV